MMGVGVGVEVLVDPSVEYGVVGLGVVIVEKGLEGCGTGVVGELIDEESEGDEVVVEEDVCDCDDGGDNDDGGEAKEVAREEKLVGGVTGGVVVVVVVVGVENTGW